MLLTIDAGNTRTKWATFNRNGEIVRHGACANNEISGMNFNPRSLSYERIIISNVAGKEHAEKLQRILSPYRLPLISIKASHQACDVINDYMVPETLGTDRWAALIAAWHIKHAPCVVVSAGTAVTVDGLRSHAADAAHGEFLGGMILPGLTLMQSSLSFGTAQLPAAAAIQQADENTATDTFARSTAQAIRAGVLHAVTGAIGRMAAALEAECNQTPFIILSGGDAPAIQACLKDTVTNPTVIVDNLVLKGLYLLDRSEQ